MGRWKQEVGKEARTGERHSKAGWQAGPSELVLSTKGSEDLPEPQWIPFLDFNTSFRMGTGTLEGSGASSNRRATATFNSFVANCFLKKFLGQDGKRK